MSGTSIEIDMHRSSVVLLLLSLSYLGSSASTSADDDQDDQSEVEEWVKHGGFVSKVC